MKRIVLNLPVLLILAFTPIATHAGCWFGINLWPFFSFGIGCGGGCYPSYYPSCYPAYASYPYPAYRYPVYNYAYAPVAYTQPAPVAYNQPVYAYRVVQPYSTVPVAVAATPTVRPAVPVATYAYARPARVPVAPAPAVVAGRPVSRTWVVNAQPYRYTPAPQPYAPPVNYVASQ